MKKSEALALIKSHVLANWWNGADDRAYTEEDYEELSIGRVEKPCPLPRNNPRVRYGDWEIEDSAGQYAEWVTIIDGRVISLGDSTLGTGDAEILCDDDDTVSLRFDGIEFTSDQQTREWGLMPEDNWPAVEAAAAKVGIEPVEFWSHYEPILNRFAGWAE